MAALFALFFTVAGLAAPVDFHGYLRAGGGTNGKGAKQECFSNNGAPGNEFRLGNECSIYGEAALRAPFLPAGAEAPFFDTTLRLAYFPSGNSNFEDSDTDGRDINIVEAFAEGGRLDGSPLTYWAGKRFYRDVDIYINDWYYYAQMNGNGAGVGGIPLGSGKLAAAYLFETGSTRTNVGLNQVQVLDLRWQDLYLGPKDTLNFWAAYAMAPGGSVDAGTAGGKYYRDQNGWLAGSRWRRAMEGGFQDFTLVHGQKLLESITLYGRAAREVPLADSRRWRFVEHFVIQPSARFGLFAAATLEFWKGQGTSGRWWNVGARPVYFFSKHYQLAFEAGHSVVLDRSERGGPRSLTRLTIAPQLSVGPGLWDRPLLRAFYSRSFWNGANRANMSAAAPSFAGSLAGQSLGVQAEVWF